LLLSLRSLRAGHGDHISGFALLPFLPVVR
jgi:hypothetical protein